MGAITANDVGLLFRIKADSSQAEQNLKSFANSLTADITKAATSGTASLGSLGSAMESMAGPAAIAAAAVASIGVAAIAVGEKLFSMAEAASAVGRSFAGFEKITGLNVEAVSALAFAAKLSGKELGDLQRPITMLVDVMGKATTGSEKAVAALKKVGVTNFKDLDGSLDAIAHKFAQMPDGPEKLQLAIELFGKRGAAEMIKILAKMGDSFDEFKKKATALGISLSDEDVKAAKEFGHQMELVSIQAEMMAAKFALQYAPQITAAIKEISRWMANNKDVAVEWGRTVGRTISYLGTALTGLEIVAKGVFRGLTIGWYDLANATRVSVFNMLASINPLLHTLTLLNLAGQGRAHTAEPMEDRLSGPIPQIGRMPALGGEGGRGARGRAGAGRSDAAKRAEDELKAQIEDAKFDLTQIKEEFKDKLEALRDEFDNTGDEDALSKAASERLNELKAKADALFTRIKALEDLQAKSDKLTPTQDRLRLKEQKKELDDFNAWLREETTKTNDKIAALDQKLASRRIAIDKELKQELEASAAAMLADRAEKTEADYDRDIAAAAGHSQEIYNLSVEAVKQLTILAEQERDNKALIRKEEREAREKEIRATYKDEKQRKEALEALDQLYREKDLLAEAEFQKRKEAIVKKFPLTVVAGPVSYLKKAFEDLRQIGKNALDSLAQGIGNIVEQWVLMGDTAPGAMRKLVASVLAGVAAQAAILAVMETAYGIAALTPWGAAIYGSAVAHFKAAALFAAVAVGSALAGRGVAGDAFKQQTAQATGQSTTGKGSSTAGGSQYSSKGDLVMEGSRNAPAIRSEVTVNLRFDKSGLFKLLKENVTQNGALRTIIRDTA